MKRRVGAVLVSNKRVISTGKLLVSIRRDKTSNLCLTFIQATMELREACEIVTKAAAQDAIPPLFLPLRMGVVATASQHRSRAV